MPVTVVCPACSTPLPGVPDELVGKSIKCTRCRQPVKVTADTATVQKAAALSPPPPPPPPAKSIARAVAVVPPPPAEEEFVAAVIEEDEPVAEGIDVEVIDDDEPAPPTRRAAPVPMSKVVAPRRPKGEEDDAPTPPPSKSKRKADDEDDQSTSKTRVVVAEVADDDEQPAPKKKGAFAAMEADEEDRPKVKRKAAEPLDADEVSPNGKAARKADDEDGPPAKTRKKSALPLILGLVIGVVVLAGGGAAVTFLLPQNTSAAVTTTSPVWTPPPNVTPPTDSPQPTTPAVTPPTKPQPTTPQPTSPVKPPVDPPKPVDPPVKPVDPPKPTPKDRISDEALARLMASTVYIEVDDGAGGGGTGSGWFGGEPGLIITNAHVLGMLYPGAKEPAKITVFTEPGVKGKQKQYEGQKVKVLAVDRTSDLAVLQLVNEKDLPPPLPTRPAAQARTLDKLVCLGFPGGRRLAERNNSTEPPVVTVTESKISAFRTDDGGNMKSVQIQGGVVHGNSGGPVCDLDGIVIGVAVRVDIDHRDRLTNIAYAVPTEDVTGLLAGRATEVVVGQGYLKGDRVVFPITVRCADAFARLRGVGAAVWVGNKGGVRPAGDAHKEDKGDIGYREVALTYDKAKKVATGEVDFPRDTDGRAYWVQPFFSNALTSKRFLAGNPLPTREVPVERTPVNLSPQYPVGSEFTLTVGHTTEVVERAEKNGADTVSRFTVTQELKAKELMEKAKAAATHVQLDLVMPGDDAKLDVLLPGGERFPLPKEMHDAKESLTRWSGLVAVGRDGKAIGATVAQTNLASGVDAVRKDLANRLAKQWADTATETVIKLPGKVVNAGDTWTDSLTHRFKMRPEHLFADAAGSGGAVKEEVTYTYLGRRDRAGRGEAVVKVDGVLRPVGQDAATCGNVEGRLVLDERTGVVMEGSLKREFDLDAGGKGATVRVFGKETVNISRER